MTLISEGFIELHQLDIAVSADTIERVYSSIPFEREDMIYKERKLTDKVIHNSIIL